VDQSNGTEQTVIFVSWHQHPANCSSLELMANSHHG
jgi:hypothetical protein